MLLRKIIFLLVCMFIASAVCAKQDPIFYDTANHKVQLSKLKGKWVVVNYWADWCSSCAQEIPELNDFYQSTRNKNIAFISVNYDGLTDDSLEKAISKMGVTFPVLIGNPAEAWGLDSPDALPTTYILNPEGKLVETMVGYNTENALKNYFVKIEKAQKK